MDEVIAAVFQLFSKPIKSFLILFSSHSVTYKGLKIQAILGHPASILTISAFKMIFMHELQNFLNLQSQYQPLRSGFKCDLGDLFLVI